jgi:Ran GTPase-activating protein (RanGAP) involved in mRNA processing and transport
MIDNESLEELYLYNNEIDDDAIDAFTEMLENKKRLRILGLEYNKIRFKAEHIMRSVQSKVGFERLYLTQNMIQPTIGEAVYELLTTSYSIRELRMNHNH